MSGKRILFGVFDWGLGHATRDTPLIRALLERGHEVEIVTTGRAFKVLRDNFANDCAFHDVQSIRPPYTKTKRFALNFLLTSPLMLRSLREARKNTKAILRRRTYDLVISDCRYDVYDRRENSFFINHQLRFKAIRGGQEALELWLSDRMRRYAKVLVPDFPGPDNLSGILSHNLLFLRSRRIAYIGLLSHLRNRGLDRDVDLFISLTGPEPQRTILETRVLEQARELPGRIVVAGGNPDNHETAVPDNVEYHSFLGRDRQEEMMNRAKVFVSRSGYTSMMELVELDMRKALLIPTPGQTEQVYLSDFYEKKRFFHSVTQDQLDLPRDLAALEGYSGFSPPWRTDESVRRFLAEIGLGETVDGDGQSAD